jgi:hypothetical protein
MCENHTLRVKSHSAGGNCTLRVEITLVRVDVTLVRFEITLVHFVMADHFEGVSEPDFEVVSLKMLEFFLIL